MAGLPRVADIVKIVSEAQAVSQPEQSKEPETETQKPSEEASSEPEPLAAVEEGQAKSPENRVPYDRFKEVNEKLKDAHEVIANFERRFQTLEAASVDGPDPEEATQVEPSASDKIKQMIEDGEIGEGAAGLFQDLAAKVDGNASHSNFLHELQLERATKALGEKIDIAIKDKKVHDDRGARIYLAQTLQNEPKADLETALKAWIEWEQELEQQVLIRHGIKPSKDGKEDAESVDESPSAPRRPGGGGGGGASVSGAASGDAEPMNLQSIRTRLSKRKRTGR